VLLSAAEQARVWLFLREELSQRLAEHRPTDESLARVGRCVEALRDIVAQLGPCWRVGLFGSAVNGFGTEASDLDATCFEVDAGDEDNHISQTGKDGRHQKAAALLKEQLLPIFLADGHKDFVLTSEIFSARVPILKFRFEGCLDVDLSCLNTEPLQNTRLLKAYAGLRECVRDLGVAAKLWAKAAEVCGAAHMHLSSYTFTLMALYYMQVDPEVQLPVLPTQAYEDEAEFEQDERVKAAQNWKCELPLERLLERFLQFYSQEFYWGTEVASLRRGGRSFADDPAFIQLRGRHSVRLHVEDPCDPRRNLNCVLGEAEEVRLQAAFGEAWMAVQQGFPPVGLFPASSKLAKQQKRLVLAEQLGVPDEPQEAAEMFFAAAGEFGEVPEVADVPLVAEAGAGKADTGVDPSTRSSASTADGSAASSGSFCSGADEALSSGSEDPSRQLGGADGRAHGAPAPSQMKMVLECCDLEAELLGLREPQKAEASPALKPSAPPTDKATLPTVEPAAQLDAEDLEVRLLGSREPQEQAPEAKPKPHAARARRMGRMGLRAGNAPTPALVSFQ
jgi:hypothetical protein